MHHSGNRADALSLYANLRSCAHFWTDFVFHILKPLHDSASLLLIYNRCISGFMVTEIGILHIDADDDIFLTMICKINFSFEFMIKIQIQILFFDKGRITDIIDSGKNTADRIYAFEICHFQRIFLSEDRCLFHCNITVKGIRFCTECLLAYNLICQMIIYDYIDSFLMERIIVKAITYNNRR